VTNSRAAVESLLGRMTRRANTESERATLETQASRVIWNHGRLIAALPTDVSEQCRYQSDTEL
jgi:hypothetical protein